MRHGFLRVDKPAGPTSHDAVSQVRRALSERSIGHLGTLDPAASGLLVLAVGTKALKVLELFMGLPKEYEAVVRFGEVSTTYDGEGVIEAVARKPGVPDPDPESIRLAIQGRFLGRIRQVPPAHSAVHVGGQRAYELARQGKQVDMPEREVEIHACDVVSCTYPEVTLRVRCGSGTYIRSLAHDLGHVLRTGAYLKALRRTAVGPWPVEGAVRPEDARWTDVLPLKEVLKDEPRLDVTPEEVEDIRHGRSIARPLPAPAFAWFEDLPIALLIPVPGDPSSARPRKVL